MKTTSDNALHSLIQQADEADIRLTPGMAEGLARGNPRMIAYVADLIAVRGKRPAIEPRQNGGPVEPGKTYTGNEAGPETLLTRDGAKPLGNGQPTTFTATQPGYVAPTGASPPQRGPFKYTSGDPLMAVPPSDAAQSLRQTAISRRDVIQQQINELDKTLPPGPQRTDEQRAQMLGLVKQRIIAGLQAHHHSNEMDEQKTNGYQAGAEWATGLGGSDHAQFGPGSTFQTELAKTPEVERGRKKLAEMLGSNGWMMAAGAKPTVFDSRNYDPKRPETHDQRVLYRNLGEEPPADYVKGFGHDLIHSPTRAFLGSFNGTATVDPQSIDMINRKAKVVFRARNTSSAESALRSPPPWGYGKPRSDGSERAPLLPPSRKIVPDHPANAEDWIPKGAFDQNPLGKNGPMHNRSQDVLWSEQIGF